MKRNFKRLFSLFLTAVMLLSVSPAAFAAESVPEEEPAVVETEVPDVPETPEGPETRQARPFGKMDLALVETDLQPEGLA